MRISPFIVPLHPQRDASRPFGTAGEGLRFGAR